jgi:hypothetical protein
MSSRVLEDSRRTIVVLGPDLQPGGPKRATGNSAPWPVLVDRNAPVTWRFHPQVTLIVQDEAARVLDTRCGTFHALEPVGTRMLLATLEGGSEAMVRTIARDYQVPEAQVSEDWRGLVEQLQQAGLTETVRSAGGRAAPGRFGIWVRLALARMSFALLGWDRTVSRWSKRSRLAVAPAPDDAGPIIAEVNERVRRIASRHLLNPQCKERALVCWHLLRRMGLPARLVMGVMLYPFTAHAWTEYRGRVVGDDHARCEQFVPVAVYE